MKFTSHPFLRGQLLPAAVRTLLLTAAIAFNASAHEMGDVVRDAGATPTLMHGSTGLSPGSSVSTQGTLAIIHGDDFDGGKSVHTLVIHDDRGRDMPVRFTGPPPMLGTRVSITGTIGADGAIDSAETTSVIDIAAPALVTTVSQNAIFILVKFLDSGADPFTQAAVQAVAVDDSNSVANFFPEVSFGKQKLNITVTPWLTAQMNTSTSCDYSAIASAANSAAAKAGYSLANYTNKFYVMPHNSACGWMGLAYIGYPYLAWSNGYNQLKVYTHELGHNFTLDHAGSVDCGTQVIGTGCTVAEYGDPFDAMGNKAAMHYNAMQKAVLGWLPSSSVITHLGGTATYSLSPIETGGATTYAVKIAAASNRTYWIEYRQPLGFDGGLSSYPNNGVQIRVASPFANSSGYDDTELLDITPGSTGGFGDATLLAGRSYTDSTYGITISVPAVSATLATVQVSTGGKTATSTALTSSVNPSTAGGSVTFTSTVTGKSPTGTVAFTVNGSALCNVALAGAVAKCTSASLPVGVDSVVAKYSGDAVNGTSTSPVLLQTVRAVADTIAPTVTITSPTNGVTVTGTTTIVATATDNVGVVSMTLSIDGAVVAIGSAASLSYNWDITKVAGGLHSITATAKDAAGNSATPFTIQVSSKTATSTALTSSVNPSTAGGSVTFTSTVTGKSPTGTVAFTVNGSALCNVALASAVAKCTSASLPVGVDSVVAKYSGDAVNASSTSPVLSQTVTTVTTVVLQRGLNGYAGASDTYLDNYLRTTARSGVTPLLLQTVNYNPLIRFAIFQSEGGPVPNGSTILSATLAVYKQYYNDTIRLNALLKPWVESQATWTVRQTGVPWTVGGAAGAGTDYSTVTDALVTPAWDPGWVTFDVTPRVSQWSSGGANYGWRMAQTTTGGNNKQFNSSEFSTDTTLRPKLTVVYH